MQHKKGQQVKDMLLAGHNYPTIAAEAGVALSTIAYHARKLGRQKYQIVHHNHNWHTIQTFYDIGHSVNEIKSKFHIDSETLSNARARGDLMFASKGCPARKQLLFKTREQRGKKKVSEIASMFINESHTASSVIRKIVRREKMIPYFCSVQLCCLYGISEPKWCGRPISLHLDHINGKRTDHRIENLRWLCPNCHSQTETYCGRNNTGDGCG